MQGCFAIKFTDAIKSLVSIVTYVVITLCTIAGTECQVVQPRSGALHKLLVDDSPRGSERPECSPAMVWMETRGAIRAQRY